MPAPLSFHGLPRLSKAAYLGQASIHWRHSVARNQTGWLSSEWHHRFRESLLHALARSGCVCPVYCVMPDHIHLLCVGTSADSDQLRMTRLLRQSLNRILSPYALRKQAFDHVLREAERDNEAFRSIAHYILENPARAGLVAGLREYPFLGAMVPGYFGLDPKEDGYWESYWKVYAAIVGQSEGKE